MTERDTLVLKEFTSRVRARYPQARIWAFGSRVRGDAREHADLDICIVLPRLDSSTWEEISDIAWEIGFQHDVLIATVKFEEEAFERGALSESPLVHAILREGLAA